MNTKNLRKKILLLVTTLSLSSIALEIRAESWSDWLSRGVDKAKETTEQAYRTTRETTRKVCEETKCLACKAYEKVKEVTKKITEKKGSDSEEYDKEAGTYTISTKLEDYNIEDISVEVPFYKNKTLVISAKKEICEKSSDKGVEKESCTLETTKKSFDIPENVTVLDSTDAKVTYETKTGLLTITIPVSKEDVKDDDAPVAYSTTLFATPATEDSDEDKDDKESKTA